MTELDYIEQQGQRNAAFALEGMELMNKRAHALLTLLLGGATATGGFALNMIGKPGGPWALYALAAISLWWFALAAWVAVAAMRTREVRAPATGGKQLLDYMQGELATYNQELQLEGAAAKDVLTLLREGEINNLHDTVKVYGANNIAVASALDRAYVAAACTPVLAAIALLLAWRLA